MKKIVIYTFIICFALFLLLVFLKKREKDNYIKKGDKIISMVLNHQKVYKELPNNLSDIFHSEEMGEGPYYEKLNDSTFIVYFNIGFDDKFTYNSKYNKWE